MEEPSGYWMCPQGRAWSATSLASWSSTARGPDSLIACIVAMGFLAAPNGALPVIIRYVIVPSDHTSDWRTMSHRRKRHVSKTTAAAGGTADLLATTDIPRAYLVRVFVLKNSLRRRVEKCVSPRHFPLFLGKSGQASAFAGRQIHAPGAWVPIAMSRFQKRLVGTGSPRPQHNPVLNKRPGVPGGRS